MNEFNLNACVVEYVFARVVEDYNNAALESDEPKPLITATHGRTLHADFMKNLTSGKDAQGNSVTPETALRTAVLDAINVTFQPLVNGDVIDRSQYKEVYSDKYGAEVLDTMNWSNVPRDERYATGQLPDGYIPISPFDERYAHRETVLARGTEILYARAEDLVGFVATSEPTSSKQYDFVYKNEPAGENNLRLYSRNDRMEHNSSAKDSYVMAGMAYTPLDAAGLSRLMPYMTAAEHRSVSPWMSRISPDQRMSNADMDNSVAILKMLQEQGIPYDIKKDKKPGQLKADIGNTKISVRLTDLKADARYIGRVYKDGYSFYTESRSGHAYQPDVADVLATIDYACGGNPPRMNNNSRTDGRGIGTISTYNHGAKAGTYVGVNSKSGGKRELLTLASYRRDTSGALDGPKNARGEGQPRSFGVYVRTKNSHSESHRSFDTPTDAEGFLRDATTSARKNFAKAVDLDYLTAEAAAHGDDENYLPIFSGNQSVAPIQQIYWDVLTGRSQLYRPTEATESKDLRPIFESLGLLDQDVVDDEEIDTVRTASGVEVYAGSPEENIRAHLTDSMNLVFGQFDPDVNGKRFNPAMVGQFMDSPNGVYRNNDNIVAAMYKLEFTGDEILGDDFQSGMMKDRLLRFDPESARPMRELAADSPFMQAMFDSIKSSILGTACEVKDDDILIDDHGVVRYKAMQVSSAAGARSPVEGMVGQIFEPDAQGLVETNYNGSANKLFTPGYEAYILPETADTSGQDFMSRVRLRGLSQIMQRNLSETIRYDLIGDGEVRVAEDGSVGRSVGTTTSINNTYRGLYSTNYRVSIKQEEGESLKDAYIRQTETAHLPKHVLEARFETARGLFHFDSEIAEGSTVAADTFYKQRLMSGDDVYSLANDNIRDPYTLTGHRNMAITAEASEHFTDPILTGSGKNQGIVRYLAAGTEVTNDGRILPADDAHARAAIMDTVDMRYGDFMPPDRGQMVGSNYMTASGVAGSEGEPRGVGVAQLTLQGFTFDDGAVISKDFAEKYGVIGEGGEKRPLVPGDKICDFSGNKSIVAKVIDRDMSMEDAKAAGVWPSVQLFKDNPELDVVQAPYSAVSRFNAASAKALMEQPMDLKLPDGSVHEGCLGFEPLIITHHTADDHTKLYGEDDVKAGRGRKVSSQLGWVFSARDCTAIMSECFAGNNGAVANYREVLNVMGLDMDETGTLRMGYAPQPGENRYVFKLPDDQTLSETPKHELVTLFRDSVDARGGVLEIPFPMMLPSGEMTPALAPEESSRPDRTMYALPVMSAHMRSGQTFVDGTSMSHDYTNQYSRIFESSLKWLIAEKEAVEQGSNKTRDAESATRDAVVAYASITDSLQARKFDTKHNAMRDDFMSHRMPHSATAVWTPDSNLNLNQIAVNGDMLKNLGVDAGDYICVWRDPILRENGVRFMEVVRDDNVTGASVNPLVAVTFDGDFDGDSVGLLALKRKDAIKEAMMTLSIEMNLLDTTKLRDNGNFALAINDSMDVISAEFADEQRKIEAEARGEDYGQTLFERRMELESKANAVYHMDMEPSARLAMNRELLNDMSQLAKDTLCSTVGTEIVSYKDDKSHMESLINVVDHKAKGSMGKLMDYAKWAGYNIESDANGRLLVDTLTLHTDAAGKLAPNVTADDVRNTELATAIKAHGTGNAGAVSQRVTMFMRNMGLADPDDHKSENALNSALKLTYLSTQGLLQAKHDPVQAAHLYNMVNGPIRDIWRGRSMSPVSSFTLDDKGMRIEESGWKVNKDSKGQPIQATKEEWIQLFSDIHESKNGLGLKGSVNHGHVMQVADALFNPSTGRMYDIEDEATVMKHAAPMDILAYQTKNAFETTCDFARNGVNVFSGNYNMMFAPKQILDNIAARERGDETRAVGIKDTQASYDPIVRKSKGVYDVETLDTSVAETLGVGPEARKTAETGIDTVDTLDDGTLVFKSTRPDQANTGSVIYNHIGESVGAIVTDEWGYGVAQLPDNVSSVLDMRGVANLGPEAVATYRDMAFDPNTVVVLDDVSRVLIGPPWNGKSLEDEDEASDYVKPFDVLELDLPDFDVAYHLPTGMSVEDLDRTSEVVGPVEAPVVPVTAHEPSSKDELAPEVKASADSPAAPQTADDGKSAFVYGDSLFPVETSTPVVLAPIVPKEVPPHCEVITQRYDELHGGRAASEIIVQ